MIKTREEYYEVRVQDIINQNEIKSINDLKTFLDEGSHSIQNEVSYIKSLLEKKDFANKLVFKRS